MADFNTHLFWSGAISSLGAVAATKVFGLSANDTIVLTALGTIGGILPDIDLRHSTPSQLLFTMFGALVGLCWLFANVDHYSALSLWSIALGIFLCVRYPIWWVFHQFTVHRGALHSVAAAIMFGLIVTAITHRTFERGGEISWMAGGFLALGYLLHLILDELYSVDFMGARIKRSFGSALKLIDAERAIPTVLILIVCIGSGLFVPNPVDSVAELQIEEFDWRASMLPGWITASE